MLKDAAKNAQKVALRTAFNQVDKDKSGVVTAVELIEYLNQNAVPGLDTSKLQEMMKNNGLGDAAEIPFDYFYVIFKEVTGQSLDKKEEKYTAKKLAALNKKNAEKAAINLALKKAFDAMNPVDGKVNLNVILEKIDSFNVPGVNADLLKKWLKDNKVNTKNLDMSYDTFRVTVYQVLEKPISAKDRKYSLIKVTPAKKGAKKAKKEKKEGEEEEEKEEEGEEEEGEDEEEEEDEDEDEDEEDEEDEDGDAEEGAEGDAAEEGGDDE